MTFTLHHGDCCEVMKAFADCSIDSVVTDPPYGLQFMGKEWDYDVPGVETWREVFRVLKPGAHLLSFFGSRTYHRGVIPIEDAGFEIRDQIMWLYGSGFPKSHNLEGAHEGWGTALKPAHEPIVVARKPFSGTVAKNMLAHGTGGLNIDGCRIEGGEAAKTWEKPRGGIWTTDSSAKADLIDSTKGRWPANVIHDGSEEVLEAFPDNLTSGTGAVKKATGKGTQANAYGKESREVGSPNVEYGDTGSAARFFYTAKADAEDRFGSKHPTVKPVDLMQWLVRLVTPKGGTVLDPFAGTGTTGEAAIREGMRCILIEREEEYLKDVRTRMSLAKAGPVARQHGRMKNSGKTQDAGPLFSEGKQ